ncbi:MAG: ribulokinase [Fimbriimonadaceae bacterium]|nr:ribulokinase [Fimbriimonadaceae bacterium]
MASLALGLDYGTNSVRGLVVDVSTGDELASAVFAYPSGEAGILLDPKDPHLARQNPSDYLKGFVAVARELGQSIDLRKVIGIGVDTTGSSPMPVKSDNSPLSDDLHFGANLHAHVWLWKDHTGFAEAAEITKRATEQNLPYLAKCGGTYSSEWFWSKLLRFARVAPDAFAATASWVEICDWIPAAICGVSDPFQIKRSRCAAGHKAMFEEEWGGLPSREFLASLDPRLSEFRNRLYDEVFMSDHPAGHLSEQFAELTGLNPGIPVAVGAFDAHFGAVASTAKPGTLVKIVGTSTCDCMVHSMDDPLPDVPGMCGIVKGSVLPGYFGLEAGQSAVGDIFNWVARITGRNHDDLNSEALNIAPGASGLLALDWHNGNRTILVDPMLSGLLVGLTLHTKPAEIYRACVEATAFGALRIIDRMEEYGVRVERVVACGGIADKSALTMQIYADVFNRPVSIAKSDQTCALGSAIFGAVVGGAYPEALSAQAKMAGVKDQVYQPDPHAVAIYGELYGLYCRLHDAFGIDANESHLFEVMKKLKSIQDRVHG